MEKHTSITLSYTGSTVKLYLQANTFARFAVSRAAGSSLRGHYRVQSAWNWADGETDVVLFLTCAAPPPTPNDFPGVAGDDNRTLHQKEHNVRLPGLCNWNLSLVMAVQMLECSVKLV